MTYLAPNKTDVKSTIHNSRRPGLKGLKLPPFEATILHAEPGRRLAKLYRDPTVKPDDFDAGSLFTAEQIECPTFEAFVQKLATLPSDACLIRGGVREDARADVNAGLQVRRLAYDRPGECDAAFEPKARNWIVLDLDDSAVPFDASDVQGSIDLWRETLPAEIRGARSAFFLSASSHISPTVRGKLIVALATPIDDMSAAAFAKAHGFDPSVCHAVQPNYIAPPIFEGCIDPLPDRSPIVFAGRPATLPAIDASKAPAAPLGARETVPADLPELSDRAWELCQAISERWYAGDRVIDHAALHLFGWMQFNGWSKGEIGSMLQTLDSVETDNAKRQEHWHILGNAVAIDGPGGAREWLGDDFKKVDAIVNYDPGLAAYTARLAERNARRAFHPPAANDTSSDYFEIVDRSKPPPELDYVIEGLELAPGKVSVVQAFANVAKTPFALLMTICVASGKDFVGFPVAQRNAMFLAFEGGVLTEEREARLCAGLGLRRVDVPLHFARAGEPLSEGFLAHLEGYVRTHAIGLVAIDTYGSALSGDIDHNSSHFAHWLRELGRLSDATGALIVVLMHENKNDKADGMRGISGHNAAPGAMQAAIRLLRRGNDRNVISVECTREVRQAFQPFAIRFEDTPNPNAPTGRALVVERTLDAQVPSALRAVNVARQTEARQQDRDAGAAVWGILQERVATLSELRRSAPHISARAFGRAAQTYINEGWVECKAGAYALTDAGQRVEAHRAAVAIEGQAGL